MIDIHCHILPEIDDGPTSVESSLGMAREAVEQGVSTIVATPHNNRIFDTTKQSINEKIDCLNSELARNNIPLKILPGQEIALIGGISEGLNEERLQSLCDTRYVLIELPFESIPSFTDKLIFNLISEGYIPVIAHPERNAQILNHPNELHRFVNMGALAQLTAGSITGRFGKKLKELSEDLIDANLVHFIASDAHAMTNRGFYLKEAYEVIDQIFGDVYVEYFKENAESLVKGDDIHIWEPKKVQKKKKKFLGIF